MTQSYSIIPITSRPRPASSPTTMDEATLDSALSRLAHLGEWSSENIIIPVFPSLTADDAFDIDICQTLRGPQRNDMCRSTSSRLPSHNGEMPFQVSFMNFRNSEILKFPFLYQFVLLSHCLFIIPAYCAIALINCCVLPKGLLAYQGLGG
jgi:hypothetical protein